MSINSFNPFNRRRNTTSNGNGQINGSGNHHQQSSRSRTSSSSQSTPPTPDTETTNDMFSGEYAKKCKRFMDLNRDLRNLGGDLLLFDMPRLTVIGGQSAGKSSLVEAVSGIKVPRDSETCTRCPMECNLSTSASSWSCTISLRMSFSATGAPLNVSETKAFGPVLTNRADVEIWLRRAQAAILNQHLGPATFYAKTAAELKAGARSEGALPFSKNTVVIDVKDPDIADLSFVDLPGLIQNSTTPSAIDLVRDLVVSHIDGENTLILITIPMSDDMENQQAVRLAREADPGGERTIGVLTKPDTVSPGALGRRKMWKELIESRGQAHQLKHGYYCVRLPDDDERARNIARLESQRLATDFFDTTQPWSTVTDRRRFGIPNFVADVGRLLVKLIENYLPKLREHVNELLLTCQHDLSLLPPPPVDSPSTEVFLRISQFCDDVRAATFGKSHKTLVQSNRRRYEGFRSEIFDTRPNFWPSDVQWRLNTLDAQHTGRAVNLKEVKQVIANSIGWELPGHVPFEATETLIREFANLWNKPSLSLFDDIYAFSSGFITKLMSEHFGQYKLLNSYVDKIVQTELERCKTETLQMLERVLALEKNPLYTLNTEVLQTQEKMWLERYTGGYRWPPSYIIGISHEAYPSSNPVPDEDLAALRVMATVRAYFDVAHKRIIDYIPLTIEHELHQALATSLKKSLFDSLLKESDTAARSRMKEFLSEDPIIAERRTALLGKQARLVEIKKRLDDFRQ